MKRQTWNLITCYKTSLNLKMHHLNQTWPWVKTTGTYNLKLEHWYLETRALISWVKTTGTYPMKSMKSIIFFNSNKKHQSLTCGSLLILHLTFLQLLIYSRFSHPIHSSPTTSFSYHQKSSLLHLYSLLKLIHTNNKVVKNVIFNEKKKSSSLGKLMNSIILTLNNK